MKKLNLWVHAVVSSSCAESIDLPVEEILASGSLEDLEQVFDWLVWLVLLFNGISTFVGYLMPNPLYTYILNIYDLVWLGFMAYQPL